MKNYMKKYVVNTIVKTVVQQAGQAAENTVAKEIVQKTNEVRPEGAAAEKHTNSAGLQRLLEQLQNAHREPDENYIRPSAVEMIFGKNDGYKSKVMNLRKEREANLIIDAPLPASPEEMTEFALAAFSHIEGKYDSNDRVTLAWRKKLEQLAQKAEMFMPDSETEEKIMQLYRKVKEETHKSKQKELFLAAAVFLLPFIMLLVMKIIFSPILVGGTLAVSVFTGVASYLIMDKMRL